MLKLQLKVVQLSIELIKDRPGSARSHSRKQIVKLAAAIRTWFVVPALLDQDNVLICGKARVVAARLEGLTHVLVIYIRHLSPEQIRAFAIAENRMSELGSWDKELLAREFVELADLLPMPELLATGFELEEIQLLQDLAGSKVARMKEAPLPAVHRSQPAITFPGDCWLIGKHRVLCADALKRESYVQLLGDERADLVITDPPFNRKVKGEISGKGTKHDEFVMASGELSRAQFQRFLSDMCHQLATFSRPGSLHFIFMDWRSIGDLLSAGEGHYTELLNVLVWMKSNGGGMGSFYRSQHELIALFKHGKRAHKNNVSLGVNGRNRTNVWAYPGANSAARRGDLKLHPTVKNLEMISEAIRDASDPGDVVLDSFGGSGTLLLGAEITGRRARMLELDPYYCDLIALRAQNEGLAVELQSTGQPWQEVVDQRRSRSAERIIDRDLAA